MMSFEAIIRLWQTQGVQLNTGSSHELIAEVEQHCQFTFPLAFKEFYRLANGFRSNDWTPDMFSLWSLEKIQAEYEASDEQILLPFCDWLIHSHHLGFVKDKPGIYKMYGTVEEKPICENFEQVLEWIALGSQELY